MSQYYHDRPTKFKKANITKFLFQVFDDHCGILTKFQIFQKTLRGRVLSCCVEL